MEFLVSYGNVFSVPVLPRIGNFLVGKALESFFFRLGKGVLGKKGAVKGGT